MDLTVEQKVQESLTIVRDKARKEAEDSLKLKVLEKEETIASMQRQIEELNAEPNKAHSNCKGRFKNSSWSRSTLKIPERYDRAVPKGEHGGDVLHHVLGARGELAADLYCGKPSEPRTGSMYGLSNSGTTSCAARAEIALIVSQALPRGIEAFDFIDGVWVTEPRVQFQLPLPFGID